MSLEYVEPGGPPDAAAAVVAEPLRAAARAVLARDGADFLLQPWQVGYLVALAEGREGFVPLGCGVGRGWLQLRLDEALASSREAAPIDPGAPPSPVVHHVDHIEPRHAGTLDPSGS